MTAFPVEDLQPGPSVGRVVVVDDHPMLALGIKAQLELAGHTVDVVDPVDASNLVADIVSCHPDLVVVDLDLPFDEGGVGLTRKLTEADHRVVVFTGSTNRSLWARCLENGAEAVLTKDEPLDDLIGEIGRIVAGETVRPHQRLELVGEHRRREAERAARLEAFEQLSTRERAVLGGLMDGLSPTSLAERDFVSVQTVRTQIKNVLAKLGVNSQLAAVARAYESGWHPDES